MRISARNVILALVVVPALVGSTASEAAAADWAVRLEGLRSYYSSRTFTSYFSGSNELTLDDGNGFSLAGEYRANRWLGLELSWSQIDLDASWRSFETRPISFNPLVLSQVTIASDSGVFSLRPLTFGVLVHPLRRGRLDLYVGPELSWVEYHIGLTGPPDRDSELAIGGKVGLEAELGRSPWSAGVAYRHIEVQHEGMERDQYTGLGVGALSAVLTYHFESR